MKLNKLLCSAAIVCFLFISAIPYSYASCQKSYVIGVAEDAMSVVENMYDEHEYAANLAKNANLPKLNDLSDQQRANVIMRIQSSDISVAKTLTEHVQQISRFIQKLDSAIDDIDDAMEDTERYGSKFSRLKSECPQQAEVLFRGEILIRDSVGEIYDGSERLKKYRSYVYQELMKYKSLFDTAGVDFQSVKNGQWLRSMQP
ncbi:hypothetical protein CSW98_04775 [Vibrio sp. HA2012]|uniref:hypothetical protein n=1 Tax=Vibrio sp. HA2012 TaxID=1971595 RepID=UPI000C2C0C65|nr:hypothetical protein [Vibrio sp. HA2012]PJC87220.1 hypothetical protein CSW98_04775 [Vibrio sp. HA2012]